MTTADTIAHDLRQNAPRARRRTLDASDIASAIAEHRAVADANPGATVTTRVVGGYVPGSYGFRAECDRVEITTNPEGRTTYSVGRATCEVRPFGKGPRVRSWLMTPGGARRAA